MKPCLLERIKETCALSDYGVFLPFYQRERSVFRLGNVEIDYCAIQIPLSEFISDENWKITRY